MQKSRQNERKICARVRDRHRKLGSPALTKLLWQVWKYIVSTDIIALDSFYCQAPGKAAIPSAHRCDTWLAEHTLLSTSPYPFYVTIPKTEKVESRSQLAKSHNAAGRCAFGRIFPHFFFYVCLPDLIDEYSAGCDKCGGGGDPRNNLNRISICVH